MAKSKIIDNRGRIWAYAPNNPMANEWGYIYESRLIMSTLLGRPLSTKEVIHHIDGNPENNDPDNLILFASNYAHLWHHGLREFASEEERTAYFQDRERPNERSII